jgi:hypothetical protein
MLGNLDKHQSVVHEGVKPYVCNTCGFTFSKKYNLNIHLNAHKNQCYKKTNKTDSKTDRKAKTTQEDQNQ